MVCVDQRCVAGIGQEKTEMAVLVASQGGRDRTSIGFQFCEYVLYRFVGGLAMNPHQHNVLEVSVTLGILESIVYDGTIYYAGSLRRKLINKRSFVD